MGTVDKVLHVVPTGAVANDLNEFTAGPPRCGTTVREAGIRLLGVIERILQKLQKVRGGFYHDGKFSELP